RRIGLGRSLLRYLGYLISWWILGIGFIWVAFDRKKQGWHDKIGGTVVVRRMN
ncbi:MAG: RDD family protein, partial [Chloroflexota bacterium]